MISFMTPRYVQYLFLLVTLYGILATLSHNDGTLQNTSKFFEKVRLSISSHKVGALKWKRPPARFYFQATNSCEWQLQHQLLQVAIFSLLLSKPLGTRDVATCGILFELHMLGKMLDL